MKIFFALLVGVTFSNSEQIFDKRGVAMTKKRWKSLILQQMAALHVQNDAYESIVETLSGILEQRDKTFKEFKESGGSSVIEYTNKGGSTNMTKNPLLVLWDDLNKSALAYWRELGMTPASFKKMSSAAMTVQNKSGLAAALESLESG